jgi:hypothetical protein
MIDPFDNKEVPDPQVLAIIPGPPNPKDRPVPFDNPMSQGTKAIQEPQVRRFFRDSRLVRALEDHHGQVAYPIQVDYLGRVVCRLPPLQYPMQDWMPPYLALDGSVME